MFSLNFLRRKKEAAIGSNIKTSESLDISASGNQITIRNGSVIVDGNIIGQTAGRQLVINIPKGASIDTLNSDVGVNIVGDVYGDVTAQNVNCDNIIGEVKVSRNLNCDDIEGNVTAGGNINCDKIYGRVK